MGLVLRRQFNPDIIAGVWEISESDRELAGMINLSYDEIKHFNSIKFQQRKRQWLSYRVLIKNLIDKNTYEGVLYDEFGKPYLAGSSWHISVAHSVNYSAAIVSKFYPVGVDIEPLRDKILRVEKKFLSDKEILHLDDSDRKKSLHILWGAKEAIYKLIGNKSLIFAEDIYIEPFKIAAKGQLKGFVNNGEGCREFSLCYELFNEQMLVYALPGTSSEHCCF